MTLSPAPVPVQGPVSPPVSGLTPVNPPVTSPVSVPNPVPVSPPVSVSPVPVSLPSPTLLPPCYICDGDPDATIGKPNVVIPPDLIPSEFEDEISKLPAGFAITCNLLDSFARGTALPGYGLTAEQCHIVNELGDEIMQLYV